MIDMNDKTHIKMCAILGIVAIEVANIISKGPDGAIIGIVIGAIAGIAGYTIATDIKKA